MRLKQILCPITPVATLQGWDWRGHTYLYILGDALIVCTRCGHIKQAYHLHNTEKRVKELLGSDDSRCKCGNYKKIEQQVCEECL